MVWKMDPFQMPRRFCIGMPPLLLLQIYVLVRRNVGSYSAITVYWFWDLSHHRGRCGDFNKCELDRAEAETKRTFLKIVRISGLLP